MAMTPESVLQHSVTANTVNPTVSKITQTSGYVKGFLDWGGVGRSSLNVGGTMAWTGVLG